MTILFLLSLACSGYAKTLHNDSTELPKRNTTFSLSRGLPYSRAGAREEKRKAAQAFAQLLLTPTLGSHDAGLRAGRSLNPPLAKNTLHHKSFSRDTHSLPHWTSEDTASSSHLRWFSRVTLSVLSVFAVLWTAVPTLGLVRSSSPIMVSDVAKEKPSEGTATVTSSIINLAKNIVGSGVLALSFGIAAFTSSPAGVVPGLIILFLLGMISAYTFSSIVRVSNEVGGTSYRDIWANVYGEGTSILPSLAILFETAAGALSYAIILGDSLASIASLADLPGVLCKSNTWIVGLSAFVLLPLSLMRNLSSLTIGSVIGTSGTLFTALFMWLRLLDGSYAPGGKFHALLSGSNQPSFSAASASNPIINSSMFVLISAVSTAFIAHFNAPKFYSELKEPTDGRSKLSVFNKVVAGAFGLSALVCASIMATGFLTFGGASQGFILNSYATVDTLAFIARLCICVSIIFSYPINFVGLRDAVLNSLKLDGSNPNVHVVSTVVLLCMTNGLALVVKNLGLVCAIGGALLGSALVYVFPAMMFIKATHKRKKVLRALGEKLSRSRSIEMYANYGLAWIGLILGVIGVRVCLKSTGL